MESPQIRPGRVTSTEDLPRVVAFFRNSAEGNSAIQFLMMLGISGDRLGVTPPERIEHGQGMVLDIACPDESWLTKVEGVCRKHGAEVHRRRR
jgi:hypothetical protein